MAEAGTSERYGISAPGSLLVWPPRASAPQCLGMCTWWALDGSWGVQQWVAIPPQLRLGFACES